MDALALLTADHNRVRGLFTRFESAHEDDDRRVMAELTDLMARELQVHTTIEEDVFYPAIREAGGLDEQVAEALEEHHVVDSLLDELADLDVGSEPWLAKVQVMIENVEHHATEEESEMFPAVRSALGADDLEDLARRLEARKAELGAPTIPDKEHLTVEELRELAREQEIPGRSTMDRDELIATVAPR